MSISEKDYNYYKDGYENKDELIKLLENMPEDKLKKLLKNMTFEKLCESILTLSSEVIKDPDNEDLKKLFLTIVNFTGSKYSEFYYCNGKKLKRNDDVVFPDNGDIVEEEPRKK